MSFLFIISLLLLGLGVWKPFAPLTGVIDKYALKYPFLLQEKKVLRQYFGIQKMMISMEAYRKKQYYRILLCLPILLLGILMGELFIVVAFGVTALVYRYEYLYMKSIVQKRKIHFLKIYPQFLNHLKIYLGAGVTLENSIDTYFESQVSDYYLLILKKALLKVKQGKNRETVFLEVAQAVNEKEMTHLMNYFIAHLQFGVESINYLDTLMEDAWRLKKETVKKQGEEASAKMVFPMMCIFLAITILTVGPSLFMILGK